MVGISIAAEGAATGIVSIGHPFEAGRHGRGRETRRSEAFHHSLLQQPCGSEYPELNRI